MYRLLRIHEPDARGLAGAGVGPGVATRGADDGAGETEEEGHGLVDFAQAPGPGRARGIEPAVVLDVAAVLLGAVCGVKGEDLVGLELGDHPGEGNVGDAGVAVAAADVGVHAGEPALGELFEGVVGGVAGFLPDGGGVGFAVLVEGEGLEGVLDVGGDFGVGKGEFFPVAAEVAAEFEEADVGDAEGA